MTLIVYPCNPLNPWLNKSLNLPCLHVSQTLLEARRINLVCLATLNRLLSDCKSLFFLAKLVQRVSFGGEVAEGFLHLDRALDPLHAQRIVSSVLIVDEVVAGHQRRLPIIGFGIRNSPLQS